MEINLGKLHIVIDGDTRPFAYQETDHLLWSYHFPFLSYGWQRDCTCHKQIRGKSRYQFPSFL